MKLSTSKTVIAALALALTSSFATSAMPLKLMADADSASTAAYHQRILKRQEKWLSIMPSIYTLQYAGGIGKYSLGIGWDYGRSNQWETHLQVGFTPRTNIYHNYWTFTLREIYNPWSIPVASHFSVKPLSVNLAMNSILHHEFWMSEPDRYPNGYYGFSSRLRFHFGLGQRFSFHIPQNRRHLASALSVYYEVSTCDLYLRQKFLNHSIPFREIITLALGLQVTI